MLRREKERNHWRHYYYFANVTLQKFALWASFVCFIATIFFVIYSIIENRANTMRDLTKIVKESEHYDESGRSEQTFSFVTYSSYTEAFNNNDSMGALHLCSTEDVHRSQFDQYFVIPRHDIYYNDSDVQKWEESEFQEYLLGKNRQNYSLSTIGKHNFQRYGKFGTYLKMTIFEVELCNNNRCPFSHGVAILAILESYATQRQSDYNNEWTAMNSKIAYKLHEKIECRFHSFEEELLYTTPAQIESEAYGDLLLKIFCQVPLALKSLSHLKKFRISLHALEEDDSFAVHGAQFNVCRMENLRKKRNTKGPAACLRPLSWHKLFDSRQTIEMEHLFAWIDYHLSIAGIQHLYLLDRWGDIQSRMSPNSEGAKLFKHLISQHKLTLISFPFFSEMQTNKHTSSMRYLSTYDQVIAYEVCLMHARQMADTWLMPLDSDEWFRTKLISDKTGMESPVPVIDALNDILKSRDLSPEEVSEIKIPRFDMHKLELNTADEFDASLWPIEVYQARSNVYHHQPRSTLNPYNCGVMNIHANMPLKSTQRLPYSKHGTIVALWEQPLQYLSIAHYTCSQVLAWHLAQDCPCPENVECVQDTYFAKVRSQLRNQYEAKL